MMIYELGNMFTARLGLEELIPLVISKCREVLDAGGVSVLLLDEERDELYFPYRRNTSASSLKTKDLMSCSE